MKSYSIILSARYKYKKYKKTIDKSIAKLYNNKAPWEKGKIKYRGVEQLVARRAHNPKVVGSSPSSATKSDTTIDTI